MVAMVAQFPVEDRLYTATLLDRREAFRLSEKEMNSILDSFRFGPRPSPRAASAEATTVAAEGASTLLSRPLVGSIPTGLVIGALAILLIAVVALRGRRRKGDLSE